MAKHDLGSRPISMLAMGVAGRNQVFNKLVIMKAAMRWSAPELRVLEFLPFVKGPGLTTGFRQFSGKFFKTPVQQQLYVGGVMEV